jgi:hypothetical protein
MTHHYLTKSEQEKIPRLNTTEDTRLQDKKVWAKLFTPWSNWTWYIVEYDGQDQCWGVVEGHEVEFGYFSLKEIAELKGPYGLKVERDKWFKRCPLGDIMAAVKVL